MSTVRPREYYEEMIETVNECMEEGFPLVIEGTSHLGNISAIGEAARRRKTQVTNFRHQLETAERRYGLVPDPSRFQPKPKTQPKAFTVDPLPEGPEPTADELIQQMKSRYQLAKAHHDAGRLRQVRVNLDGPIGLAFFGDPHVDDPGCAWTDLERDVRICRDTPGILAVNCGDVTNNWVGRLQRLYADQEVTSRQALKLIEWFMGAMPWLMHIKGNHDVWNTDKGDPADYIARLLGDMSVMSESGQRLRLTLPLGAEVFLHVRHDFPGNSQFNPAHALVRETLFNFRDHILVAAHRHTTGYIPVWHNDPARLCHGFRVGAYKDMDHYAQTLGLKEANWARSLGATVDPAFAHDPVRFIKPWFSLEDMAEYLTWRRAKWEMGKSAA